MEWNNRPWGAVKGPGAMPPEKNKSNEMQDVGGGRRDVEEIHSHLRS